MYAQKLQSVLMKALPAGLPIMIKGAPGGGKTDLVTLVAMMLGWDLIVSHPVTSDPTDPKGLPAIVKGLAEFLPFGDLRKAINVTTPTVWLFDDFAQATATVMNAYMQLFLSREINGIKISDNIVFVVLTNRKEDMADVTPIPEPVKSRFASIIQLDMNVDDWNGWAAGDKLKVKKAIKIVPIKRHPVRPVHPMVVAFLNFRKELFHTNEPTKDIVNHPCPRTWVNGVSQLLYAGIEDLESLAGAVGMAAAIEFAGFMEVFGRIPDVDTIIKHPMKANIPDVIELAVQYAISSCLIEASDKNNFDSIIKYAERLPKDFMMLIVDTSSNKSPGMKKTKGYVNWFVKYANLLQAVA